MSNQRKQINDAFQLDTSGDADDQIQGNPKAQPRNQSAAERAAAIREERAGGTLQRVLGGFVAKLVVHGTVPGYHLHIANDDGNRISDCLLHGFTFVERSEIQGVNENVTSFNNDPGGNIRFTVGTKKSGEPMYGYLMKIPQEIWDEDEVIRNQKAFAPIEQMRKGFISGGALSKDDVEDMAGSKNRSPITVDISSNYSRGANSNGT